ncbi:MAG: hypothetical protein ACHREM_30450, partial [Polyangiales bacterium]
MATESVTAGERVASPYAAGTSTATRSTTLVDGEDSCANAGAWELSYFRIRTLASCRWDISPQGLAPRRDAPTRKRIARTRAALRLATVLLSVVFAMFVRRASAAESAAPPAAAGGSAAERDHDDEASAPRPKKRRRHVADDDRAASSDRARPTRTRSRRGGSSKDDDDDDTDGVTIGAEADVVSRFVWRGMALSDGGAVQPSAWVEGYGFTATIWSNVLFRDEEAHGNLSAVVPAILYAFHWKALRVEPSLVLYHLNAATDAPTTLESAVEISLSSGNFRVFTTHAVDVAAHLGGWFGTVGGALEVAHVKWTLTFRGDVGFANAAFNSAYFRVAEIDPDVLEGHVALRRDVTDEVYVEGHVEVSTLLAQSLRSAVSE